MAACDPLHYHGINRQTFESIRQELAARGFPLPEADSGRVNGPYGIVVGYTWNPEDESLVVEVLEKNFFVPCSQIEKQFNEALRRFIA